MKKLLVTLLALTLLLASCGGNTTTTSSADDTASTEITSSVEDTSSTEVTSEDQISSAETSSLQEISSTETTSSEENNVNHIGKKVFSDNFADMNLWKESDDVYIFNAKGIPQELLSLYVKRLGKQVVLKTKEEYRVGKNFTFEIAYTASASEGSYAYIGFVLGDYAIGIHDEDKKITLNFKDEEVGVYTDKENPFEFNKITLNVKDGVATLYADNEQIITAEVYNGSFFSKIQLSYSCDEVQISFDSVNIFSE